VNKNSPGLLPKHVWSIRTKLQIEGRTRDLAMFNLAIDSKLRPICYFCVSRVSLAAELSLKGVRGRDP